MTTNVLPTYSIQSNFSVLLRRVKFIAANAPELYYPARADV